MLASSSSASTRQFRTGETLAIVKAIEDGLLIIRYLFGFRGATLIGGAVPADCTRCSATAIESYLASLMP